LGYTPWKKLLNFTTLYLLTAYHDLILSSAHWQLIHCIIFCITSGSWHHHHPTSHSTAIIYWLFCNPINSREVLLNLIIKLSIGGDEILSSLTEITSQFIIYNWLLRVDTYILSIIIPWLSILDGNFFSTGYSQAVEYTW